MEPVILSSSTDISAATRLRGGLFTNLQVKIKDPDADSDVDVELNKSRYSNALK
jgi:hypothetical protein